MATQLNNSVSKAFAILRLIGPARARITAADVVREAGLNAVTAHRFLKTLEAEGALVQAAKGTYRLGYGLVELGDRALADDTLGALVQPELDRMTADLGEASMATLYQAGMVVCVARAVSHRSLSVDIRVGHRLEAYCTAHGKLWLAHLPEPQKKRYLDAVQLRPMTVRTLADRAALESELAATKARGFAFNHGEREEGITAVAVPVLTEAGRMIVGLSVFGPTTRMSEPVLETALGRLRQAAGAVKAALYGKDFRP